jgi:DNA polymerase-3 subunit delta
MNDTFVNGVLANWHIWFVSVVLVVAAEHEVFVQGFLHGEARDGGQAGADDAVPVAQGTVVHADGVGRAFPQGFVVFEAFLKADATRFCRIVDGLQREGEGLPYALAILGSEIRTLYRLAAGLQRGERLPALMAALRVWESRQALLERALKRADLPRLIWAMHALARLDRAAKGLLKEDGWDELKQLGLALMKKGHAPAFVVV